MPDCKIMNIFRLLRQFAPRLVAAYVKAILPAWNSWKQRRSKAGRTRRNFHAVKSRLRRPVGNSNRAFLRRACRV